MAKNIKITERQYRLIQEDIDNSFIYFSDNDNKHCDGQTDITANGKIEDGENGKPVTTDKIQRSITPQMWNRYRSYGNVCPRTMKEGINPYKEEDTADDIGEVDAFDSPELENDNLVQIPQTVKEKMKIMMDSIKKSNLNSKQQGVILNDLVKQLTSSSTSYPAQKALDKKIRNNKNLTNQVAKNISNND